MFRDWSEEEKEVGFEDEDSFSRGHCGRGGKGSPAGWDATLD